MHLLRLLLQFVVLVHTSAWQLDQHRQIGEDGPLAVRQPTVFEEAIDAREIEQPRSLDERRSILDGLIGVVTGIIPGVLEIINQEDRECEFVSLANATILLEYRDLNVVIFHDTESNYKGLHDPICFDQDVPLPFGFGSKNYRICAFDTGTFIRHGDGGCRNWGFGACAKRTNDRTVSFCRRGGSPTTTASPQKATSSRDATTTRDDSTTRVATTSRSTTTPDATTTHTATSVSSSCSPGQGPCSCNTGMVPCDSSCIPSGSVCCGLGGGTYCAAGYYCFGTGCCKNGESCTDGDDNDDSLGATTVVQKITSTVLQTNTPTSSSGSLPTAAMGLPVPVCLGVGVAGVLVFMG